ncbi:GGDEF domain-containing protein [Tenggerimyces flavus]|uniref:GGDEF domain-containing protein n=1 Tax=Tenggerimyces flavus TaxID=1708749 RepID=A0ABV7Y9U7_9ACTN|nr:GGDEF domain-containing protein [Tenggerimyces flavus]MBM7783580.1 diguanylate cyclase (GGDEF)-like protein [Tenggerimyces flavus]
MSTTALLSHDEFQATVNKVDPGALLSLALIDVDNLARVNDEHGHAAGDAVLRDLEEVLAGSLPADAILGRVGGDEYAVALPGMAAESALIVLEEIRQHVADREPVSEMAHKTHLSIGIAGRPTHAGSVPDLFRAAEESVYRAKSEGRNRTALYVESKMVLKSNYYSRASLDRLAKLSSARNRTEASLLREGLDDLLTKHRDAI